MTLRGSPDVGFLLLAGRSVLGRVTDLTDVEEMLVEETTPLGQNHDSWGSVGQKKWTLDQNGFYDSATGAINEALALTGEQILMYALDGNAVGSEFLGAEAVRSTYERLAARGTLHKARGKFVSDAGPDRGYVGAPLVARTTEGPASTTTIDWGVAYANQAAGSMIAYLGVSALTLDSATGLAVIVRDSADDITYADAIAFTAVTLVNATERKTLAAASAPNDIERYTQVQWEFTGTPGGNQTATFAVGIARSLT